MMMFPKKGNDFPKLANSFSGVAAIKVMVQKSTFNTAISKLSSASHYNFKLILKIVFNCFAKTN